MKHKNILYICFLCLLPVLLFLFGSSSAGKDDSEPLTLMVYMTGSDLETKAGAASADLREMMEAIPEDDSLQVLVMASGAVRWQSDVEADAANIYRLTRGGLELALKGENASMGSPDTLLRLLEYGSSQGGSGKHALILWDHGAGPLEGLCFDECFRSGGMMDGLTLEELVSALAASPFAQKKLAWIGFDACLMATMELACCVSPYADYMIASQEPESASGWNYSFLSQLGQDSSGADTGRRIVADYMTDNQKSPAARTLSCVDLSSVGQLTDAMSALFASLDVTQESYASYAAARVSTKGIGYATSYEYDLVDLRDLLQEYSAAGLFGAEEALALFDHTVVCSWSSGEYRNGLSIYYPFYNKQKYVTPWGSLSAALNPIEGYNAFLNKSCAIWLGDPIASWKDSRTEYGGKAGELNVFTLTLSEEQRAQLAKARLTVIEEIRPGEYSFVYTSDAFRRKDDTTLEFSYDSTALYAVDADGSPLSGALSYRIVDDAIALNALLRRQNEQSGQTETASAFLFCRRQQNGCWLPAEITALSGDMRLAGKAELRLEDWDTVEFVNLGRSPVLDDNGQTAAFDAWDLTDSIEGYEAACSRLAGLSFLKLQDGGQRYALVELSDCQNNTVCSMAAAIPNPNIYYALSAPVTLIDDDMLRLTLLEIRASADETPELISVFEAENRTDRPITVRVRDYTLDDSDICSIAFGGSKRLAAGERARFSPVLREGELKNTSKGLVGRMGFRVFIEDGDGKETLLLDGVQVPINLDLRAIIPTL